MFQVKEESPTKEVAEDIDGNPLDHDSDDDGQPMDGAALLKTAMMQYESDIDEDIDGKNGII